MTNIAMENEPFVDDVPIKTVISMAMLNNQRVYIYIYLFELFNGRQKLGLNGFRFYATMCRLKPVLG